MSDAAIPAWTACGDGVPGCIGCDAKREGRTVISMDVPTLEKIRAEAWDAGYQAAYLFERGEFYPEPTNPHRP